MVRIGEQIVLAKTSESGVPDLVKARMLNGLKIQGVPAHLL